MFAITITCIILFFALMIGVGVLCRKKAVDVNGFVLGGRSVGPWLTAFAFGTSYFSAVIFVGYAGQFGWNFGLASTWIGLGNAFIGSLLAWVILGRRTRLMTKKLDSSTMPDFFERRYRSRGLRIAASIIVFVFLIPYTASLYNGLSSLFDIALGIPYYVCIIVMALFTAIYVIWGGYMATAVNDFIQGIIMLGGIVAVIVAVVSSNGGLSGAVAELSKVPSPYPESQAASGAFTSFFGAQPVYLLVVVLLTSLGTWGLPQMIGKFYSIKNEDAIHKGTIISTIFAVVVAGGCYFIGGFGRLYTEELGLTAETVGSFKNFDSVVPTILSTLPEAIITIVIVLVLAASMSTLSSLVLTSSATLTLDVIIPMRKKETSEKHRLVIMRVFIAFFVIVSAVIAIVKDAYGFTFIAQMMGVSWGALAGAFLAPFLYGLYWKKTTPAAVVCSFIWGVGMETVQLVLSLTGAKAPGFLEVIFRNSLYSGVVAMLGSLILVPIVSLLTQKQNVSRREAIEEAFSCYTVESVSEAKDSLGK